VGRKKRLREGVKRKKTRKIHSETTRGKGGQGKKEEKGNSEGEDTWTQSTTQNAMCKITLDPESQAKKTMKPGGNNPFEFQSTHKILRDSGRVRRSLFSAKAVVEKGA